MKSRAVGMLGESIACTFLARKGYVIRERNYRRPWGEIDVIAQKDATIHFIEVKAVSGPFSKDEFSRETGDYRPEGRVHVKKLEKIFRTAELYVAEVREPYDFQVDVIGVFLDENTKMARCRMIENVAL